MAPYIVELSSNATETQPRGLEQDRWTQISLFVRKEEKERKERLKKKYL
jgi:hypothetical protein